MKKDHKQLSAVKATKEIPKKISTDKAYPRKPIITALKKFMAARNIKIEKQLEECNYLVLSKRASQLAARLADQHQVAAYICELNQEAIAYAHKHQEKLRECESFWYGPEGLKWLALKKNMEPQEWLLYDSFMDDAARRAFQELSLQSLAKEQRPKRAFEIGACIAVAPANADADANAAVGDSEGDLAYLAKMIKAAQKRWTAANSFVTSSSPKAY